MPLAVLEVVTTVNVDNEAKVVDVVLFVNVVLTLLFFVKITIIIIIINMTIKMLARIAPLQSFLFGLDLLVSVIIGFKVSTGRTIFTAVFGLINSNSSFISLPWTWDDVYTIELGIAWKFIGCGKDKLKFPNSSFFMMNVSERGNKLKSNGATVTSRL